MAFDFRSARHWAQALMCQAVEPGARIIDATMGNGRDTAWLCRLVGEAGRVYAFDIQPQALERTRARLIEEGLLSRAQLFLAGHDRAAEFVPEPVDGVLFNLGWLPGGEKTVTTRVETTLKAVTVCLDLLKEGGLMTICAYPGHPEGRRELDALLDWVRNLPSRDFDAMIQAFANQPGDPPVLLAVKKNLSRAAR